jgi:hypothetical protein
MLSSGKGYIGAYGTAQRLRKHHGYNHARWWAEIYFTEATKGSKKKEFWGRVHDILKRTEKKKKRNPPKLDKVVVRYASRLADQVIAGIKSGKIRGDTLYEEKGVSFRGHWEYGLKVGKRPINLTVINPSNDGSILVPNQTHLPVQITTPGWRAPDRSMLIHELVHYLQAEYGDFPGTAPRTTVGDYLDQTHERDAYFAQLVADINLKRVSNPEKAVKTYFSKRRLWGLMKTQTRKHHINRLTEYLEHLRGL